MRNPRSHAYLLIEERLGRPLDELVSEARGQGDSWNRIAFDIHEDTRILVTSETLRIWFGIKEPASA